MRDFRDAKLMAQTLRESLTAESVTISHSKSLELVSRMLGISDWNTLSALLQAYRRETGITAERPGRAVNYPAMPLRDLVPFPAMIFPLIVGREKAMHALDQAFEYQQEIVLAVQREAAIDEPGFDDVYEVGVLAKLVGRHVRLPDGTWKVLVQARRRVVISRFIGEAGAFQAEIADIAERPIPDAPELIQRAAKRFESYAAAREIQIRPMFGSLDRIRDPGRVADIISAHMKLTVSDKQSLLATLDPVMRLERVEVLMDGHP